MATERMNESWQGIRNRIENIWNEVEFADDDMKQARGSLPKMVDLIQARTGEPRTEILQKMNAFL